MKLYFFNVTLLDKIKKIHIKSNLFYNFNYKIK